MKFYDTCALLTSYKEIFNSEEKFYISNITINELENIKTAFNKDENIKYDARQVLHLLEKYEDKYKIIIYRSSWDQWFNEYDLPITNDSKIIVSAFVTPDSELVTNDLSCKAIAKSIKLKTSYQKQDNENEYTGFLEIQLNEEELAEFYSNEVFTLNNKYNLLLNQYLIIKDNLNINVVDTYKWTTKGYEKVPFRKTESKLFGKTVAKDKDIYQHIALDSLFSNQINMLRGPAGSGKSYLAFSYMFHLLEEGKISKIIVFCNTVATKGSAKLGFYPGSRTEKLMDSQIGNFLISKLGDRTAVERLIEDESLVLLPMSDIRGYDTSGMNAAVYITEAQNLDIELMKLALQRIGEDSICILDGDSNAQVDLAMYAGSNNGMRRVCEVFKGEEIFGTVTLQTIKRSKIAELADKL